MLSRRHLIAAALAHLTLAACAGPAAGPASTDVALSITGAADMNGGAPAQVKIYYLSDTNQFSSADFFTVFDAPEATLGDALMKVQTFGLAPGRTVTDAQSFAQAPDAVGVVAAFRDINGQFLAVKPLVPGVPNPVTVTLAGNRVDIR